MAAPTLISVSPSTNFATTSNNKATASISWLSGDLITVWGFTGDSTRTLTLPTATGLTFTQVFSSVTTSRIHLYLWTATAGSSGSSAIASTHSNLEEGGIVAKVWRGAASFGTPVNANNTTGAAAVSLTLTALDSAVDGGWGDWNAVAGARTYLTTNLGTATEDHYYTSGTFATTASWHNADTTATGAQSVGLSAPTSTAWIICAIEVLGSAGAAAAPPPFIPHRMPLGA